MPLKPTGSPAEEDRFEIRFTMRDGETLIDCFADEDAIDDADHDGNEGDPLLEKFARHRPAFEAIASWLYDDEEPEPRVELHHLRRFREL